MISGEQIPFSFVVGKNKYKQEKIMGFLDGNVLWHLCWVLPLFLAAAVYTRGVRKKAMVQFLGAERAASCQYSTLSKGRRRARYLFLLCSILLLFLAAARFYWGAEKIPYSGKGRDLLVVFDVSKSMLAEDVKPSRLAQGKYLVQELLKANPGDRFGLIAFAGSAFLECPLTLDRVTFSDCVEELSPESIPLGGTNIEEAVRTALQAFKGAESSSCAIILITDGDELQGASSRILSVAKKRGIPLLIAGIGEPSLPGLIRVKNEAGDLVTLRDSSGKAVDSRLNEKALRALAAETNGVYVRSTSTDSGVGILNSRIHSLEREKREKGERVRYHELPQYPLGAALFFLLLFFLTGERKREKKITLSSSGKILLIFLFLAPFLSIGQEKTSPLSLPGNNLSATPAEKDPFPPPGKDATGVDWYNYGVKLQEANKASIPVSRILEAYRKAYDAGEKDPELRAKSMLNYGSLFYRNAENILRKGAASRNPQEALKSTKEALAELEKASEAFRESMTAPAAGEPAAKNQQLLLHFREKIKEYQKKLEELIKQQQKAREDARKAMENQKRENQQKQQKQNQKKEEQKQDRKQDRDPSDSARQAQKSIQDLKEQAKSLRQKALEKQAEKAEKEVEKALQARKEKRGKEAEKHLEEAVKALGQESPQKKNDPRKKDGDKQEKQDKQKKRENSPPEQKDPSQKKGEEPPRQAPSQEKKLDRDQAKRLLELMAGDEKTLKDELKARQRRLMRTKNVEKDW